MEELVQRMKALIPWDDKPATVTTETFKRIKDYVLDLKEEPSDGEAGDRHARRSFAQRLESDGSQSGSSPTRRC